MAAAVDVDEVWAEMQKETRSGVKASRKITDISKLQRTKTAPKKKPVKTMDTSMLGMAGWSVSVRPAKPAAFLRSSEIVGEFDSLSLVEPPATLLDALDDIPTGTPETFLAYIQRDVNCLGEDSLGVRQQSLLKLERILVQQVDSLSTDVVDASLDALMKPLLKRMKDKSEKCRELAVKIMRTLVENASDLAGTLPYVFPVLVSRLGAEDLDGIAHLPEVMRPDPEQKPMEIARPVEESEDVRLELARFVASLLARCSQTQVLCYIDEATGLVRAQAMDPFHEVKAIACETMISFCHNHTEMLLHFSEPMGRSLTSCITHNHAKIRIAGLRAITAVLWCGVWKHNFEILSILMAWQDPNKVQVKAFYEGVTSVNYMSHLSFDRHPAVRRFWFETMTHWLLRIPDKCDLEPYLFPYLLTGLCDDNEDIALQVFWLIERCGELYEEEKEADLRKNVQYGFDYGWTYAGRGHVPFPLRALWAGGGLAGDTRRAAARGPDLMGERQRNEHYKRDAIDAVEDEVDVDLGEQVELPARDYAWPELQGVDVFRNLPRPRLGSRCWVRTHTRRYIKATFNDVTDFRDCTTLNAGRLLCMSVAYTEEGVTEWLQPMLAALTKFFAGRAAASGDKEVMQTYSCVAKLLGCFLDPDSYWEQFKDVLDSDSFHELDQRVASLRILALCIEGSVEVLMSVSPPDPTLEMGRLSKVVPALISAMFESDMLLSPSEASRENLWMLVFSFLEPLRAFLSPSQVSQLVYIVLSLSASVPPESSAELAGQTLGQALQFEEAEVVDAEKLNRALAALSTCLDKVEEAPTFSLDSLDDDDDIVAGPSAVGESADASAAHLRLFQLAFPEVMARAEDSFQVFRSVLYLSPFSVLMSKQNSSAIMARFENFADPSSSQSIRLSAQALGIHLALRCTKFLATGPSEPLVLSAQTLIWDVFRVLAEAQIKAGTDPKYLSYSVMVNGMSLWRRFFMHAGVAPGLGLFHPTEASPSRPLQWLTLLLMDQELYKRFHKALELAESSHSGKSKDDFVLAKTKNIREESEHRAAVVRSLAASTLLLLLRLVRREVHGCWPQGPQPGSPRAIFNGVLSLFRTREHTIDPPFVKPTPAFLIIYAAELLRLLFHRDSQDFAAFRLRDDAARAIHDLSMPASPASLPLELRPEESEAIVLDFIDTLMKLNLTLPPDPDAKHAPTTLAEDGGEEIVLGWDPALSRDGIAPAQDGTVVPREVTRVLSQSVECLRWNAALGMYALGLDLCVVCRDGFARCIEKWRRRKEQARLLVVSDMLIRAKRTA